MSIKNNTTSLQDLLDAVNALPEAGSGGMETTPVISVNSKNGLITATAGTKFSTHQLAFQTAKTITPSDASQIAVSSGYYTGGNITVAAVPIQIKSVTPEKNSQDVTPDGGKFLSKVIVNGDANLLPENIKSGVSIFGVSGTCNDGNDLYKAIITRTITGIRDDEIQTIGNYAFYDCSTLTTVSFPAATTIGDYAFHSCKALPTVSFPAATAIGTYAFGNCSTLTTVSFPAATTIGNYAFYGCIALPTASFPAATSIGTYTFDYCGKLKSLYLTGSTLCTLSNSKAFSSTPIGGYSTSAGTYGSIYVPASLLTSYKTATNWTYFSSRFVGI